MLVVLVLALMFDFGNTTNKPISKEKETETEFESKIEVKVESKNDGSIILEKPPFID